MSAPAQEGGVAANVRLSSAAGHATSTCGSAHQQRVEAVGLGLRLMISLRAIALGGGARHARAHTA